ncbi:MAG: Holliday junction resolvase RuvX [Pseudomonadales bacterium]
MGFDFGMGKIGVAVGQAITGSATPLTILKARDGVPDWQQVEKLIHEWQPARLIVGLPLNMDGSASEMSRLAEKFSRKLHGRFNLPADTMDERLTSFEAAQYAEKDELVDAIAAQLILESWFKTQSEN